MILEAFFGTDEKWVRNFTENFFLGHDAFFLIFLEDDLLIDRF